ncbi:MAG: hypothetical protein D6722_25370, partial [Bacteroidetes bacterium]
MFLVLDHWYYLAIGLGCLVGLTLLYTKLATPVYRAEMTLLLEETQPDQGGASSTASPTWQRGPFLLENELGVLTSYELLRQVVRDLGLEVAYYEGATLRDWERYETLPFRVVLDTAYPQVVDVAFRLTFLSQDRFRLQAEAPRPQTIHLGSDEMASWPEPVFSFSGEGSFGAPLRSQGVALTVEKNRTDFLASDYEGRELYFIIRPPQQITKDLKSRLRVFPRGETSTVLDLQLSGPLPRREIHVLQALCQVYQEARMRDKNRLAQATIAWIDSQLQQLTRSAVSPDSLGGQASDTNPEWARFTEALADLELTDDLYQYLNQMHTQAS